MRRLLSCLFVISTVSTVFAERIPVPRSQFQSRDFVKSFVGAYGFLSDVEPKVDAEESRLLADLAELFDEARYSDIEARLVDFIKARRNPIDPEQRAQDVSPAMIFILGQLYLQNSRFTEAERSFKEALKRFPKFRRARKNLGLLYAMQSKPEEAKVNLLEAIKLGDGDHRSYGLLGWAYLSQERVLAAEGAYRHAYTLAPDEKDWKMGLAQCLLLQEKWREASAMLGELLKEDPENKLLWIYQASAFIEMDQKLRAATNYEILRLKGLADGKILTNLGNIYIDQGQSLLALGAYLAALETGTELDMKTSIKTAKIMVENGAHREAMDYLDAARATGGEEMNDEDLVDLLLVRVDAAKANGDVEEVGRILDRLLELDPTDGNVLVKRGIHFGELAAEAPEEEEDLLLASARTNFRLALENPDPAVKFDANLRLGQMLAGRREYLKALPPLQQALKLKPNSSNLQQYIRQIDRQAKRQREREEREEQARAEAEARARAQEAAKRAEEEAKAEKTEESENGTTQ